MVLVVVVEFLDFSYRVNAGDLSVPCHLVRPKAGWADALASERLRGWVVAVDAHPEAPDEGDREELGPFGNESAADGSSPCRIGLQSFRAVLSQLSERSAHNVPCVSV